MTFPTSCCEDLLVQGSRLHGLGVQWPCPSFTRCRPSPALSWGVGAVPAHGRYRRKPSHVISTAVTAAASRRESPAQPQHLSGCHARHNPLHQRHPRSGWAQIHGRGGKGWENRRRRGKGCSINPAEPFASTCPSQCPPVHVPGLGPAGGGSGAQPPTAKSRPAGSRRAGGCRAPPPPPIPKPPRGADSHKPGGGIPAPRSLGQPRFQPAAGITVCPPLAPALLPFSK